MPDAETVGKFLIDAAAFYKKQQVRLSSAMAEEKRERRASTKAPAWVLVFV